MLFYCFDKAVFLFLILIAVLLLFARCGASAPNNTPTNAAAWEKPHLHKKSIDVEVTEIEKRHWFYWYQVDLSVKSEEYGLTASFSEKGSGTWGCPKE